MNAAISMIKYILEIFLFNMFFLQKRSPGCFTRHEIQYDKPTTLSLTHSNFLNCSDSDMANT